MTHNDLCEALKAHHATSAKHHDVMARAHRGLAQHFEVKDPTASAAHLELADAHRARAVHHKEVAEKLAGTGTKVLDPGELQKALLGSEDF